MLLSLNVVAKIFLELPNFQHRYLYKKIAINAAIKKTLSISGKIRWPHFIG